MKKLAGLNYFTAWLILAIALVLFSGPAQAYIYDDFTSSGINSSLWVDTGPNYGLFSQPGDGYLYFNDASGGQRQRLRSFNSVNGVFAVAMQYSNFQADNEQPAGQGKGSAVILRVGFGETFVDMIEYKNAGGLGFQANSYINGGTINEIRTPLNYVPTNVNSGWLGIVYNGILGPGGEADFWYDSGAGWTWLASCAPNFSQAPFFSIRGSDYYGESMSFKVDQVQLFTPVPLPASVWLLGSSLLGLWGFRRMKG